ncbi:bifunctional 2-polyprenyl-6-hydroxyphenol methylase/3-demethylubiquinol 3-O-methyltransferase UbiG [Candidatus Kinetoplastidibacterium blastocrithidiae]|uniref:bifunctional 2-polyprenyl-6-hydroxyphenol methylase/3-demethylubiquinol 3-O-methyltransferase UbiG n=1 Tax=Candidatus Kinetoplastidibacterium blastocrithidiae TaxID=233181 RepID=UPI0004BBDA99|nr:bifunctional 2-polyprenyl-6-hydroxyphenol methylase/3-demethylubiquinol 3-O-methyltransferase UbiG [Candidatus Kinetoplastibacterium blastocrithidii]
MKETNVYHSEIDKFNRMAEEWWDKSGNMKTLHEINILRLDWILRLLTDIKNKSILDIGCGGGILSESLAALGAEVTGIDLADNLIKIANSHSSKNFIDVNYRNISAEELSRTEKNSYDVIVCMEMLEHVPEPASIIKSCSSLVKDGGSVFFSTINRNLKSFIFSIIGAEYILKLLPVGTHKYELFIKPSELVNQARMFNLELMDLVGLSYNPINGKFYLSDNVNVNYFISFRKNI